MEQTIRIGMEILNFAFFEKVHFPFSIHSFKPWPVCLAPETSFQESITEKAKNQGHWFVPMEDPEIYESRHDHLSHS